jgi:hypothetical protein
MLGQLALKFEDRPNNPAVKLARVIGIELALGFGFSQRPNAKDLLFEAKERLRYAILIGCLKGRQVIGRGSVILPHSLREKIYKVPDVDAKRFQERIAIEFFLRRGRSEGH